MQHKYTIHSHCGPLAQDVNSEQLMLMIEPRETCYKRCEVLLWLLFLNKVKL